MSSVAQRVARRQGWNFQQDFRVPALVAVTYYLGAEAAFLTGTLSDKIFAPFWPPNIVLFCALLLSPLTRWWLFIAAVLPAHIIAELSVAMTWPAIMVAFVTNCLVSATAAYSVQSLIGKANWFASSRNAAIYVLLAIVLSPAIAAVGGAFVQILNGGGSATYSHSWARWYVSNAVGFATLGPFAMVLLERKDRLAWKLTERPAEVFLLAMALIATSTLAFSMTSKFIPAGYLPTLLYLPLPLIMWATIRFGVAGASGSVLIVGSVLLWRALNGNSLFNVGDAETNVFAVQVFLIGLAVPVILLGAAVEEARRAVRLTRESEERMAFAAASTNIGLWTYTFDTGAFWATAHSRRMFGLPPNATFGIGDMLACVHPGDFELAASTMKASIDQRLALDFEVRIQERDGKVRWVGVRARPHQDEEGAVTEMTGTFVDVTARKRAEEEALMRQQEVVHLMRVSMLGELSGGLAHELTQPLTAILSNAQAGRMLLTQPKPDLEEIAGIFDDIIVADDRAGEVIHRLRSLLKKGEVRHETVDVNALIESTLHLLHSEIISRRVTMSSNMEPQLPTARGDPVQLQQVLLNLLLNAIDAMEELSPSRRIVLVKTRLTDKAEIEVSISDRGTGLPKTEKEEIFKPFFTTKRRGLGLGLSICNSIIRSHGGSLTLENNVDEGATARFRLPT